MTIEIGVLRSIFRSPDGAEFEDLWIEPFYMYLDTQNVILLRRLEIAAKRKQEENYIKSMLGEVDEKGRELLEILEEEYPHLFPQKKKKAREKWSEKKASPSGLKKILSSIGLDMAFVKRGPYETHFEDRITGIWFPDMMASVYMPSVTMLKAHMQVPGFKSPT